MIRAAIAGGTGYTGGELLRILLNHPMVRVTDVLSSSADGIPVADIHRDLIGETDLKFGTEMHDPDVLFLCLGHSLSREFIHSHNIGKDCRIIDLGNDFVSRRTTRSGISSTDSRKQQGRISGKPSA